MYTYFVLPTYMYKGIVPALIVDNSHNDDINCVSVSNNNDSYKILTGGSDGIIKLFEI